MKAAIGPEPRQPPPIIPSSHSIEASLQPVIPYRRAMVRSWLSHSWLRHCLVWLVAPALSAAVATRSEPSLDTLRAVIPPALRPEPNTVPEAGNAARILGPLLERRWEQSPAVKSGLLSLSTWDKTIPATTEELSQARAWLAESWATIEAARTAAAEPGCRFPSVALTNSGNALVPLTQLGTGLLADARERWRRGARTEAVRELKDTLTLSSHITGGANTIVQYLVASLIRRRSLDALRAVARSPEMTATELKALDDVLARGSGEVEPFRASLRRELWDAVIPGCQLENVLPLLRLWGTNDVIWAVYPEDLRRPLELMLDPKLLASHPRPFDAERSAKQSVEYWTEVDRRAAAPWNPAPLPDDSETVREKFLADLAPLLEKLEDEDLPLSDDAVAQAAPLFAQVKDPMGRFMESLPNLTASAHARPFELATRWDAARTSVAIRRWALDHRGALPDTLQSLVTAGLLPELPLDRFSGAPLHYAPARQLLWSVGKNGRDDQGQSGPPGETGNSPDDLLWPVQVGPAL